MNNLKLVIIILILILGSCTQTYQTNGLSKKSIENFDITIGKTSKKYLIDNYGPPIFENVFNENVFYYVSHGTSYKNFNERKTEKLLVLEITLNDQNIVQNIQKFSNNDSFQINVSKNKDDSDINFTAFWKDLINALRRRNTEN